MVTLSISIIKYYNLAKSIIYGKIKPYTITPDFLTMVYGIMGEEWRRKTMTMYKTAEVAATIGIHPNTVRLYEKLKLILKPVCQTAIVYLQNFM